MLGASPGDIPHDDASYTGEVSTMPWTLDYYRAKAGEFQQVLNALDASYSTVVALMESGSTSGELFEDLWTRLDEFDARKSQLRLTAEAINAGASVINSLGGRFPQLSIPQTLGLGPIAIPVAAIAALGTAAVLGTWGVTWIRGLNERLKYEMSLNAQATPEQRAQLAASVQATDNALREADSSIWSVAGTAVKWVALAVIGVFAFRAISGSGKRS